MLAHYLRLYPADLHPERLHYLSLPIPPTIYTHPLQSRQQPTLKTASPSNPIQNTNTFSRTRTQIPPTRIQSHHPNQLINPPLHLPPSPIQHHHQPTIPQPCPPPHTPRQKRIPQMQRRPSCARSGISGKYTRNARGKGRERRVLCFWMFRLSGRWRGWLGEGLRG